MTDQELQAQFRRCQEWQDAEQWEQLALQYTARGYALNARRCFELADQVRSPDAVSTETASQAVPA
jgi:hypothetical protein